MIRLAMALAAAVLGLAFPPPPSFDATPGSAASTDARSSTEGMGVQRR
jgi:hypothetical protein